MTPTHVVFRADASVIIGSGHVMRCLTLADGLKTRGATCHFVTRALSGHLGELIKARGFEVSLLDAPENETVITAPPAHAAWAGVTWEQDLADTRAVINQADWLIVDHYAFDERWQSGFDDCIGQIMIIDDLADRPHKASLLLDQNLGRKISDYGKLVPANCDCLAGPNYALLRPEFASQRIECLARRNQCELSHIMISMGGMDKDNATGQILAHLKGSNLPKNIHISVVMGSAAPYLEETRLLAAEMPCPTNILCDVTDMAGLMTEVDLAIGGAGGTSWERCCLGLPTLIMTIADNQIPAAKALDRVEAGYYLGDIRHSTWQLALANALERCILEPKWLYKLSMAAAAVCEGKGTARVVNSILKDMDHASSDLRSNQLI